MRVNNPFGISSRARRKENQRLIIEPEGDAGRVALSCGSGFSIRIDDCDTGVVKSIQIRLCRRSIPNGQFRPGCRGDRGNFSGYQSAVHRNGAGAETPHSKQIDEEVECVSVMKEDAIAMREIVPGERRRTRDGALEDLRAFQCVTCERFDKAAETASCKHHWHL